MWNMKAMAAWQTPVGPKLERQIILRTRTHACKMAYFINRMENK